MATLFIEWLKSYFAFAKYILTPERKRAGFKAHEVLDLNKDDAGQSLVRLHGRYINGRRAPGPHKFNRKALVRITNKATGRSIVRFAVGAGSRYSDLKQDSIALDYDAKLALALDLDQYGSSVDQRPEEDLTVRPAFPWEERRFFCFEYHSVSDRMSHIDSTRGLFLGLIGLVLGIISFF